LAVPKKNRTVQGCEEIINEMVQEGFTNQINWHALKIIIKKVKGGDPRTVANWRNNLFDLGYLEQPLPGLYKVNLLKCPGVLEKAVTSDVKQKKLF
jgi:hypothetical protein